MTLKALSLEITGNQLQKRNKVMRAFMVIWGLIYGILTAYACYLYSVDPEDLTFEAVIVTA